jgi:hypothetical protein
VAEIELSYMVEKSENKELKFISATFWVVPDLVALFEYVSEDITGLLSWQVLSYLTVTFVSVNIAIVLTVAYNAFDCWSVWWWSAIVGGGYYRENSRFSCTRLLCAVIFVFALVYVSGTPFSLMSLFVVCFYLITLLGSQSFEFCYQMFVPNSKYTY